MAGILPGVEAARIRRIHQSDVGSARRSSFCLYATNYQEFHIPSFKMWRAGCDDEKLEAEAREAKKRLDRKFQTHWKTGKNKSKGSVQNFLGQREYLNFRKSEGRDISAYVGHCGRVDLPILFK